MYTLLKVVGVTWLKCTPRQFAWTGHNYAVYAHAHTYSVHMCMCMPSAGMHTSLVPTRLGCIHGLCPISNGALGMQAYMGDGSGNCHCTFQSLDRCKHTWVMVVETATAHSRVWIDVSIHG